MENNVVVVSLDALEAMIKRAIDERLQVPAIHAETPKPDIIDIKELCRRLNVTAPTVRQWRKKKKIPSIKAGRSVRFNYPEVLKALTK